MASDIVPIQLSLTEGDLVTLWAPRWREDGEEWEAFLGDDDALFAFPEVAQLAAFVRTAREHDLVDHPAWSVVPDLSVAELTPEDRRRPTTSSASRSWRPRRPTSGRSASCTRSSGWSARSPTSASSTSSPRSSTPPPGSGCCTRARCRSPGARARGCGPSSSDVIAERWDDVIDALDDLVDTPDVDAAALATARKEEVAEAAPGPGRRPAARRRHRRAGRRRPGRARGLLGRGRHRPDPDHHPRRRVRDAALLHRRHADLPRLGRHDRRLRQRARAGRAGSPRTAPTATT